MLGVTLAAQTGLMLVQRRELKQSIRLIRATRTLMTLRAPNIPPERHLQDNVRGRVMKEPVIRKSSRYVLVSYRPEKAFKAELKGEAIEVYWSGMLPNDDPTFIHLN